MLHISEDDQQVLRLWIRAGTTPQRVARRARIVLLAAEGRSSRTIAQILNVSPRTALLWRRRYQIGGVAALRRDAPGRGRKPQTLLDAVLRARRLLENPPANGHRWTIRRLAATLGLSRGTTHRVVRGMAV